MRQIFFLIFAVSFSLLFSQQVYANHIDGLTDDFYWREHDVDDTDGVECTFEGVMQPPFENDTMSFSCVDDTTNDGVLYIIKVLEKNEIYNSGTNVFTWEFDNECSEASCGWVDMVVMDGAYTYNSLTEPGGFPSDIDYQGNYNGNCYSSSFAPWAPRVGTNICLRDSTSASPDLDNIFGTGYLNDLVTTSIFQTFADNTKGTNTPSVSISNSEWQTSTQDYITVILYMNANEDSTTNWFLQPRYFSITNTPQGTMQWDFPESDVEAQDWLSFGGDGAIENNGTNADYGYFFSYDPDVPDPPTNLYAVTTTGSIDLFWTAPEFTGFKPLLGYKIERESPVGGGWSTLVPNTSSNSTTYSDTTVSSGNEYNYRVRALNTLGESDPSNESNDSDGFSDPLVTCPESDTEFLLQASGTTTESTLLCWNGAQLTGSITGYQINSTTPWGDPQTFVANVTNSTYTKKIQGLQPATQYSFRIQSWQTSNPNNLTNIANITTLPDTLDLDNFAFRGETNPFRWDWGFTETDLGGNYTELLVDYPSTVNATCIFDFRFANTQQNFTNISTVPSSESGRVVANFTLQDPESEVIYVTCYDEDNPDSEGRHIIYQSSFPLIEQIQGFRTGEYGTSGDFGAFDLITLVIVIISMIGFNRVNSAVAAFFSFAVITISAFFEFISPISAVLMGVVVLAIGIGIFMHHRNEASP